MPILGGLFSERNEKLMILEKLRTITKSDRVCRYPRKHKYKEGKEN